MSGTKIPEQTYHMNLDFTRQTLLQTIFYFVVLMAILWSRELFFSLPLSETVLPMADGFMPFSSRLMSRITPVPWLHVLLAMVLLFFNAFFLTRIVIRHVLFINRSYLPSLIYLLYSSLVTEIQLGVISQWVVLLLLTGFENLFMIAKTDRSVRYVFNGMFFIGLASLFYLPAAAFLLLGFVALFLYERFYLKEWIVALAGFLACPFFYSYGLWLIGGEFSGGVTEAVSVFGSLFRTEVLDWHTVGISAYLLGGLTFVYIVYAMVVFFRNVAGLNIMTLKSYVFFVWMLVVCLTVLIFCYSVRVTFFPILAVPLTVLFTVMIRLLNRKVLLINVLLGLLLAAVLFVNMMNG